MSDEMAEVAGTLFLVVVVIAVIIAIIVYVIVPLFLISMGIGALCGGGSAVYNYATAFRNNVHPEKI